MVPERIMIFSVRSLTTTPERCSKREKRRTQQREQQRDHPELLVLAEKGDELFDDAGLFLLVGLLELVRLLVAHKIKTD